MPWLKIKVEKHCSTVLPQKHTRRVCRALAYTCRERSLPTRTPLTQDAYPRGASCTAARTVQGSIARSRNNPGSFACAQRKQRETKLFWSSRQCLRCQLKRKISRHWTETKFDPPCFYTNEAATLFFRVSRLYASETLHLVWVCTLTLTPAFHCLYVNVRLSRCRRIRCVFWGPHLGMKRGQRTDCDISMSQLVKT